MGCRRRVRAAGRAARRVVRRLCAGARDSGRPHSPRAGHELHGGRVFAGHRSGGCVRGRSRARAAERIGRAGNCICVRLARALHRRPSAERRSRSWPWRAARDPRPARCAARSDRPGRARDPSRGRPWSARCRVRRFARQRASTSSRHRGGLGHHASLGRRRVASQARPARPEATRPRADRRGSRCARPRSGP